MIGVPKKALKRPLLAAALIAALFGAALLVRDLPESPAPAAPVEPAAVEEYAPRRMTLEGTLVCLPHAPGYPPTKECTLGLRADDGTHYVVDFMLMSSIPEEHRVGDRVTGNG